MRSSRLLVMTALVLSAIACTFAVASWLEFRRHASQFRGSKRAGLSNLEATGQPVAEGAWLEGTAEEKFNQIGKQLRGLDKTMVEVGYRFTELYFAGKEHNWDYAKYQTEKMDTAIRLGLERRPKRAQSAQFFLTDEIPAVLKAIESKDDETFQKGMDRMRSSCMKCHNLEKVPYFTVEFPEHRLSPVRNIP